MAIKATGERRISRSVRNDRTGERISRAVRNDGGGQPMTAPTTALWQTKKRGCVGVSSPAQNCGSDKRTLESLKAAGWHLYRDGEKVF